MLHKYFKEIQQKRGIKSKNLAKAAKMSESNFSKFTSGKLNLSTEKLWALLNEMEKVSPGAREEFGLKIAKAEFDRRTMIGDDWEQLVETMPYKEIEKLLNIIGKKIGRIET